MKKYFLLLLTYILFCAHSSVWASEFASPVSEIGSELNLTSNYYDYFVTTDCAYYHHRMISSFEYNMKELNIGNAISAWSNADFYRDGCVSDVDGSDSSLFWSYAPEGTPLIPVYITERKAYKNGIVYLGKHCNTNCTPEDFYIGFMKYKKWDGLLHVYNEPLAPKWSKQFNSYESSYKNDYVSLYADMSFAFKKWKFNNKNTNMVYKKFIQSIR